MGSTLSASGTDALKALALVAATAVTVWSGVAHAKLGIVSIDANAVSPVAIGDTPELLATSLSRAIEFNAYGVNLPTVDGTGENCAVDIALEYTTPSSGPGERSPDPNLRIHACGVSKVTVPSKLREMIVSDKSFRLLIGRDTMDIVALGSAPGVPEYLVRVQLEDGEIASLDELGSRELAAGKKVGAWGQIPVLLQVMTQGTRNIILDRETPRANDRLSDVCDQGVPKSSQGITISVRDFTTLDLEEQRAIKRIRVHGQMNRFTPKPLSENLAAMHSPKIAGYATDLAMACDGSRENRIWISLELIADLGPRAQRALLSSLVSIYGQ